MRAKRHYFIHSGIITIISFIIIIAFIWVNELFDLPHLLLKTRHTPTIPKQLLNLSLLSRFMFLLSLFGKS